MSADRPYWTVFSLMPDVSSVALAKAYSVPKTTAHSS